VSNLQPLTAKLRLIHIFDTAHKLVFHYRIGFERLFHFCVPTDVSAPLEHIHVDVRLGSALDTVIANDADASGYSTRAMYVEMRSRSGCPGTRFIMALQSPISMASSRR
jgi:hypothetical protein